MSSGTLEDKNVDTSPKALHRGKYTNVSNITCILQKSHSPWLNMRDKVPPTVWGTHMFFLPIRSNSVATVLPNKRSSKNIHHLLRGIIEVYFLLIKKGLPFQGQAKTECSSHWQSVFWLKWVFKAQGEHFYLLLMQPGHLKTKAKSGAVKHEAGM